MTSGAKVVVQRFSVLGLSWQQRCRGYRNSQQGAGRQHCTKHLHINFLQVTPGSLYPATIADTLNQGAIILMINPV
jgi:hypothetical protein